MEKTAYQLGQESVLVALGLTKVAMDKEALRMPAFAGKALRGVGQWTKKKFMGDPTKGTKGILRGAKEMAVGTPIKSTKEILSGKGWSPGGSLRESFSIGGKSLPKRIAGGALMYGLPAHSVYKAVTNKDPNVGRGEQVGQILGSTLGGYGAWKPYGMVGSVLVGQALGNIGARMGRMGDTATDKLTGKKPQPQPTAQTPYEIYQQHRQNN